jgi:ATP-dependent DNA ligase
VKRHETVPCAVVRIRAEGARGFNAFVLASEVAVRLAYAGKVGTGFDAALRQQIPVVPVVDVPCKTCRRMRRSRRVA